MYDWQIGASLTAVIAVVLSSFAAASMVKRLDLSPEQRQRTRNMIRYGLIILLAAFLVMIWASQIRSAAFIFSAFAVAIVLATKETIMNIGGWWIKTMSGAYRIGDRIQIGAIKGDVMDYGVLTTTLMNVTQGDSPNLRTGAVVTFPNSMLLTEAVINETHSLEYTWREISLVVDSDCDWQALEQVMLESANEELASYQEEMAHQLEQLEKDMAFRAISIDARVFVSLNKDGKTRLTLRLGLPVRDLRMVENKIVRKILSKKK
ncbi:MAG TPA: mechanosensitive ion channel [Myxococcales bacterium]|nr:mechanosensitive ion channel [Myxococcales bacterium]HIN86875.1 mechanosensitive ion channel [Myxococcales bacterium]